MFFSGRNIDGTREGGGNLGEILECEASANKLLVRLELSSCHLQIFIYTVYLYLGIRVNEAGLGLFGGAKFHFIFSLKLNSTVAFLFFVARVGYVLVNPFTQES